MQWIDFSSTIISCLSEILKFNLKPPSIRKLISLSGSRTAPLEKKKHNVSMWDVFTCVVASQSFYVEASEAVKDFYMRKQTAAAVNVAIDYSVCVCVCACVCVCVLTAIHTDELSR